MREDYIELLKSTNREGIEGLIKYLDDNGFFKAPASTSHHLSIDGGLLEHSLNVNKVAMSCSLFLESDCPTESVILVTLLHDIGKIGDYGKQNYVPNMIKSKEKDEEGNYPLVQSEAIPYKQNKDLMYIPHEVRSLMIAERFIKLTEDESFAILYHNGLYGDFKYVINGKETQLYLLLHMADMWASRVMEVEE